MASTHESADLHGLQGDTWQQQVKAALLPSLPFVVVFTWLGFPGISSFGFRALAPCECFEYEVRPPGSDDTHICFLSTDRNVICEYNEGGITHAVTTADRTRDLH